MVQVDRLNGLRSDIALKAPCRVATTAAITLSGLQTIDGVSLAADDRVLVKNQAVGADNGIWVVMSGTWDRAPDFDGNSDVVKGTMVRVVEGTVNAGRGFQVTTANPITIGSSSIAWSQVSVSDIDYDAYIALYQSVFDDAVATATADAQTAQAGAEAARDDILAAGFPVPGTGDAGKVPTVNQDEDGYELVAPASNGVDPAAFGTITYGAGISSAAAIANRDAIQAAIDYCASQGGGTVQFRPGYTYEIDRTSGDYALLVEDGGIYFDGGGSAVIKRQYDEADEFILFRISQMPATNGRVQIERGGFRGLEIDGGAALQKITNGKFHDDTTGWTAVNATLSVEGGGNAKRKLRVTTTATSSSNCRAYQAVTTVIGKTYYVRATCTQETATGFRLVASATNAFSGSIQDDDESTGTALSFTFTATGTTTYILLVAKSDTIGQYADFEDVRMWEAIDSQGQSLIQCSGLKDYIFDGLHLHDSTGYAIGLQNGGHQGVKISNTTMEDIRLDGIDHKNNGSISNGNSMVNVTLRRCALSTDVSEPAACLDLSQGWTLSNVTVEEFGTSSGTSAALRFKNGDLDDDRGIGGHHCQASSLRIAADDTSGSSVSGVLFQNTESHISDFSITDCPIGIKVQQEGNSASNGVVSGSSVAGLQTVDSSYTTNGDEFQCVGVRFTDCAIGADLNSDEAELVACFFRSCGINVDFAGNDNQVRGGRMETATTQKVKNAGTGNIVRDVKGFKTASRIVSANVGVDSTGTRTPAIAHGLAVTPTKQQCVASVLVETDVNDYQSSPPRIHSTDATNVNIRLNVTTASGTGSAVAKISVSVDASEIPAIA